LTNEIGVVYFPAQMTGERGRGSSDEATWTFLTNHSHVLLCLVQDPEARMRDVADRVGITERAVQRIVAELEAAGYVNRIREGRRNRYEVNADLPLRHPVEGHRDLSALIKLILGPKSTRR
jgi:predicted transcriptional regulator